MSTHFNDPNNDIIVNFDDILLKNGIFKISVHINYYTTGANARMAFHVNGVYRTDGYTQGGSEGVFAQMQNEIIVDASVANQLMGVSLYK